MVRGLELNVSRLSVEPAGGKKARASVFWGSVGGGRQVGGREQKKSMRCSLQGLCACSLDWTGGQMTANPRRFRNGNW